MHHMLTCLNCVIMNHFSILIMSFKNQWQYLFKFAKLVEPCCCNAHGLHARSAWLLQAHNFNMPSGLPSGLTWSIWEQTKAISAVVVLPHSMWLLVNMPALEATWVIYSYCKHPIFLPTVLANWNSSCKLSARHHQDVHHGWHGRLWQARYLGCSFLHDSSLYGLFSSASAYFSTYGSFSSSST